jgi:lipopolysaccharide/colanic/teichoic acid biosynthesis glycosyltransferase
MSDARAIVEPIRRLRVWRQSRGHGTLWPLSGFGEQEYDDPPVLSELDSRIEQVEREASVGSPVALDNPRLGEAGAFFRSHFAAQAGAGSVVWTIRRRQIEALPPARKSIAVLQKINNCRWVNKFLRAVNSRLENGGVFAGCVEVHGQRRARYFRKFPGPVAHIYCLLDFVIHRIWPKIPLAKRAYFPLTRGHNRPIAAPELLGRLVSCGFEILEHKEIKGLMHFAVRKVRDADVVCDPSYGPFCRLKRVGRGGRLFTVYKFRTMHPYSEFLQEYVYRCNSLQSGGKFKDDFRITPWGKWLRRWWIDELPMLINLFRGQMKIVGVRPLSTQYFGLYPSELQDLRQRNIPGMIPPFYADLPKSLEEIVASELTYLRAYEKAPFLTDLRYFLRALRNILGGRARSS